MKDNILLYELQTGDTLESIGYKFGMTAQEILNYHNSHCDKMNRLWFNNLAGVRQIIIPKQYKSPDLVKQEKEKELPPASFTRDFYADTYLIEESHSGILQDQLDLEYKVDINFRQKDENNYPFEIADVRTYDFIKNGSKPDDKMSLISLACMQSISPISFIIPMQGKISGFFEFERLKKKFEEQCADLEDFFIGDVYQSYLKRFSENLNNRDYALKMFTSMLLYQLLFPKMDWFHKTNAWTEQLYFIPNSILLKCSMSANYYHKGIGIVETKLRGNIKDMFSLQDILRGKQVDFQSKELADGEIELLYKTDKKSKGLLEAEASITFWNGDDIFRKQTLKLTHDG